jgi:hypothetical protein
MSTTTLSLPMAITLPLTISPSFTSSRLSDSSKSAAKLSSMSEAVSEDEGTATMSILCDANNAIHVNRLVRIAAAPLARSGNCLSSLTPTIGISEGRRKLPLLIPHVNGTRQSKPESLRLAAQVRMSIRAFRTAAIRRATGQLRAMRSTTSSGVASDESISMASSARRKGPRPGRCPARRGTRISAKTSARTAGRPAACNSRVRRCARVSRFAIRKNFACAEGKTTVPMSRPSATTLAWAATLRCMSSSPARTSGDAETRDAPSEISALRMASVTSRASAKIRIRSASRTKTISSALAALPNEGHRPKESACPGPQGQPCDRARQYPERYSQGGLPRYGPPSTCQPPRDRRLQPRNGGLRMTSSGKNVAACGEIATLGHPSDLRFCYHRPRALLHLASRRVLARELLIAQANRRARMDCPCHRPIWARWWHAWAKFQSSPDRSRPKQTQR